MKLWKAPVKNPDLDRWAEGAAKGAGVDWNEVAALSSADRAELLRLLSRRELSLALRAAGSTREAVDAYFVSLGLMESSLEAAFAYVRTRVQGGRPILQWSQVGKELGDLLMRAESFAALAQTEIQWPQALFILDELPKFVSDAMQIFGGAGYMKDFPIERKFREAHEWVSIFAPLPLRKVQYFLQKTGRDV
jgi:hypothetical protein